MGNFFKGIVKNRTMLILFLAVSALVVLNILLPEDPSAPPETTAATSPAPAEESPYAGVICISELMTKNRAVLRDSDGDFSDWIELENRGGGPVTLSGWSISDKERARGWVFPEAEILPGEQLLVFASGKDRAEGLHTDFSLSAGETVSLYDENGAPVCSAGCGGGDANVSLVFNADGSFAESLYPSPGFPNGPEGYDRWQRSLPVAGPVIISEVMPANFSVWRAGALGFCDWVEIKNISDEAVLLSDYYLSDDDDDYRLWRFPEINLAPGALLMVCCDDSGQSAGGTYVQAPFALDSVSEELFLSGPDGLCDYVFLRDIPYECSYGQSGDGGWFFYAAPTPGWENGSGFRRVSDTPLCLSGDGVFDGVSSVTVALSGAGKIYYSTDGSLPTENSALYEGPFAMEETGIIRAISVEEGAMPSRALTLSCIINQNHSLPVLSLVSDSPPEFNAMYSNGIKDLELPGSLSLYEEDGGFTIPCGIKMHGETSLILPKKNMSVRFRGAYGQETLNYDAFGGGVTEFSNFILRAGQDYYSAIIRNELCENLCLMSSDAVIAQRSKYCVLYINGEYSGIYALLEKTNEQQYARIAGVSRDSVTVIEAPVPYGSDLYEDVFRFCFSKDMRKAENYAHFCSLMDVDSLIDWIILEGYCANADLSFGNLRYCRSTENDGKWRFMFYDLDSSFFEAQNNFYNLLSAYSIENRQVSQLIGTLMGNTDFRGRLLARAAELLDGPLSNDSVVSEIDRLAAVIAPEVERDYARYGMTLEKWNWNIDFLRDFISARDWRQHNVDTLCDIFDLSSHEREAYFGS